MSRRAYMLLAFLFPSFTTRFFFPICLSAKKSGNSFIQKVSSQYSSLKFTLAKNVREAVEGADIVTTATPSRKPLVEGEWVKPGIHINAIGADAPGKQELNPEILRKAKIVVDDWEQACHGGEVNVPLAGGLISKDDIHGELGEIVAGLKPGRTSMEEVTIFVSTGLAIQDAVTANLTYRKAVEKGLGTRINLRE
jgi:alanine dehydrogenase